MRSSLLAVALPALAVLAAPLGSAATLETVIMMKFAGHEQTSATDFGTSVSVTAVLAEMAPSGPANTVSLARAGTSTPLVRESPTSFEFYREFDTEAAMNAAFPDAAYTLVVDGGNPSVNFTFPAATPPAPLRITNFDALQNHPGTPTIRWTPPPSASPTDLLLLTIERESDGEEVAEYELQPGTTSVQATDLPRDTPLKGNLTYARLNVTQSGSVIIGTARGVLTRFPLRLASNDRTPPRVIDVSPALGATVPPTGPIVVTWSEPMRTDYTAPLINTVEGRYPLITWSADGLRMTITFDQPLPPGYYSLQPFGRPVDLQNNAMEEDTFVIQFAVGAPAPRFVSAGPEITTVAPHGSATLRTRTLGSDVTYRWERNGVVIPGATNSNLILTNLTAADISAIYRVTATNPSGSVSSGDLRLLAQPGQTASNIVNLSVRTTSGAGDNMLIVGFTIAGGQTSSASVLLRGIGPALLPFGVTNALPDPRLALFSGTSMIAASEDWGSDATISSTASRVGAFALPPNSRDAALVQQLGRGSFTVQISDVRSTGVALAEIYHAGTEVADAPRLVNLSARAASGTGSNALVAGFVLTGNAPRLLLIRAAGPALRAFSVGNALADPRLIIRNGTDAVALNNYWGDFNQSYDVAEAARSVGAFPFPSGSKDAALVVSLNPGAYTAEVSSVDGTTGIALIEVYELAP